VKERRSVSAWEVLARDRRAFPALVVLVVVYVLAFLGPLVWRVAPETTSAAQALAGSSLAHPFGTDDLGRDELARLLSGARVTLVVGLAAMATALILGTLVGAVAAFYGGAADAVLMRVTDGMMAVPAFFVILVVITVTGPSITTIVLVIGAVSWMPVARVVYGETLRWKGREFVVAAEALGVSRARILLRHVLPQAVPALTVSATLGVAYAILTESAISYLGLGVQAPTASWGNMLQKAQQYVFTSPSLAMYPGLAVTVVVLAFNFLGDGIRDALDPRMRA